MDRRAVANPQRANRRLTAFVWGAAGGVAVALSQWHVLPPMLCFAVLVAGLLALGVAALLLARLCLPGPDRDRPPALITPARVRHRQPRRATSDSSAKHPVI